MTKRRRNALLALLSTLTLATIGFSFITSFAGDAAMDKADILKTIEKMTTAFAAADIDKVMTTYEPDAVVVAKPGKTVGGVPELRQMFGQFVAAGVNFTYGAHDVIVAGDLGLHLMKWTAPGPGGDLTALSVAVLRRQDDGTWKMVIDHPFGDAVMK
jgi:ketosteroid isomerase-like protein